jgi:hypothetical protein
MLHRKRTRTQQKMEFSVQIVSSSSWASSSASVTYRLWKTPLEMIHISATLYVTQSSENSLLIQLNIVNRSPGTELT